VAKGRAAVSVLVTGSTGFIGREVVRNLLMAERAVIAAAIQILTCACSRAF